MKLTTPLDKMVPACPKDRIRKIVCHDVVKATDVKEALDKMGADYTTQRVKNKPEYWVVLCDVDRQTFYDLYTGLVTTD